VIDAPETAPTGLDAETTVDAMLAIIIATRRSPITLCAAARFLLGKYKNYAQAARAARVDRSTIKRAVNRLQSELKLALVLNATTREAINSNKDRRFSAISDERAYINATNQTIR
jgi:hypothetical protein